MHLIFLKLRTSQKHFTFSDQVQQNNQFGGGVTNMRPGQILDTRENKPGELVNNNNQLYSPSVVYTSGNINTSSLIAMSPNKAPEISVVAASGGGRLFAVSNNEQISKEDITYCKKSKLEWFVILSCVFIVILQL